MMSLVSWIAVLGLLSVLGAPAAPSFAPDEEYNGPTLNGAYVGHQGPSLNGSSLQPQDARIRGFAVEAVELPDGSTLAPAPQPASVGPDVPHNGPGLNGAYIGHQGPSLNGAYIGEQGPSLNGAPLQAQDPRIRGFAVEGVELADGTPLGRSASFGPDEQHNSPRLNGGIGGHQGPSLNGAPLQPWDPKVRGFAVEAVDLPDGRLLAR
jgi:hypothetical protein